MADGVLWFAAGSTYSHGRRKDWVPDEDDFADAQAVLSSLTLS